MKYLTLGAVLRLHDLLIARTGGSPGVRDQDGLESAIAQPLMGFDGRDFYPSIETKAAALCFSLVMNHPFVDGNKRIGHAAMETFLVVNGFELVVDVGVSEETILSLAAGSLSRDELVDWITSHLRPMQNHT